MIDHCWGRAMIDGRWWCSRSRLDFMAFDDFGTPQSRSRLDFMAFDDFGPPPQEEEGWSMEQEPPARWRSDGPSAMPGFKMNRLLRRANVLSNSFSKGPIIVAWAVLEEVYFGQSCWVQSSTPWFAKYPQRDLSAWIVVPHLPLQ